MDSKKRKSKWKILTAVFAIFFIVMIVGGQIANNYASVINMVLGVEASDEVDGKGTMYYEADYKTSKEQATAAEELCEEVVANGAVLLKNEMNGDSNALPLKEGAKVTLFGKGAVDLVYGGSGSGSMDTSNTATLKEALEKDGYSINSVMWDFYTTGAGSEYTRQTPVGSLNNYIFENSGYLVNEVPMDKYTDAEWSSVEEYKDAAIVVFGRVCGEGSDLPWFGAGDGNGNILELSDEEQALLKKLANLKEAGKLDKIIVLLNSSNAMELDFLNPAICGVDYRIDACMWIGELGQTGVEAIGDLLCGKVNPSGKLVDTYCYNNLTSPAIQNAHVTSYTNAAERGLAFDETCNEYYVVYQEGIYVGYRYYETRYEDFVLGNAKVGNYDYDSTVAYAFGYGLSYTEFEYSDFQMEEQEDSFKFIVQVTNTGNMDGKEVVQVYMQSPYTEYDRQNGIEKASVELVGYTKVDVEAGKTVQAEVIVDKSEMRSYDSNGAKTYIVDAGNYYFATGNGAHEALNNILAAKATAGDTSNGTVNTSKMTAEGNKDLVSVYQQQELDTTTYAKAETGADITNQFDHGDLNKVDGDTSNDVTYLTRSNWSGTMPKAIITAEEYKAAVQIEANDVIANGLTYTYEKTTEGTMPTMGAENGLSLVQFVGVEFDESITVDGTEYTWDDLLDQVTFNEMAKLVGIGYHSTASVSSVGKPATKDENGPQGITAKLTGGAASTAYPSADLRAATYDVELVKKVGRSMGNDCLLVSGKAYSGIYGPGANIHRTPYSGRNFEYYSEDPFISGTICANEVAGIQSKGVYVYIKHFALNDQETGRDGICVWSNEQASREIYLQAFEYPIVESDAYCVMTSFNRIGTVWAGGDYNLLTNVLRGEWGMPGFVLTDYSGSNDYMDVRQGLLAGGDSWDCSDASKWADLLKEYKDDPVITNAMREATKHVLYTVANSNAMNGISVDTEIVEVRAWWQNVILFLQIAFAIMTVVSIVMVIKDKKKN